MTWNMKCKDLLKWSERFVSPETIEILDILGDWKMLIINSRSMWEKLVAGGTIVMELGDQEDHKEELILDQEEVGFEEEIIDVE
jgi:hypothetical protein